MDPVTLIVTALAAGAASALQDGVSAAVKDACARLAAQVKKRFADRPKGELVLAEYEAGSRAGKYVVSVRDSQGVQIADHNTQINTFGPRPD